MASILSYFMVSTENTVHVPRISIFVRNDPSDCCQRVRAQYFPGVLGILGTMKQTFRFPRTVQSPNSVDFPFRFSFFWQSFELEDTLWQNQKRSFPFVVLVFGFRFRLRPRLFAFNFKFFQVYNLQVTSQAKTEKSHARSLSKAAKANQISALLTWQRQPADPGRPSRTSCLQYSDWSAHDSARGLA